MRTRTRKFVNVLKITIKFPSSSKFPDEIATREIALHTRRFYLYPITAINHIIYSLKT